MAAAALLAAAVPCAADLKALFAFNGRLVSARMPRLDYRIATAVEEYGRRVMITTPRPSPGEPETAVFVIEIRLETVPADAPVDCYFALAAEAFSRELGLEYAQLPAGDLPTMRLPAARSCGVSYSDQLLRPHKGILVAAVAQGLGICIFLDAPLEWYDEAAGDATRILQSIEVEGVGTPY